MPTRISPATFEVEVELDDFTLTVEAIAVEPDTTVGETQTTFEDIGITGLSHVPTKFHPGKYETRLMPSGTQYPVEVSPARIEKLPAIDLLAGVTRPFSQDMVVFLANLVKVYEESILDALYEAEAQQNGLPS